MKRQMLIALLLCLPAWATAQNDEQMQRMMEQAREAQMCMEKVDRNELQAMAQKAEQMEAEIKNLCLAGKRDEAQQRGMKYALEMSQSPVAKEMRKCSDLMAGAMAGFGADQMGHSNMPSVEEIQNQHICDTY